MSLKRAWLRHGLALWLLLAGGSLRAASSALLSDFESGSDPTYSGGFNSTFADIDEGGPSTATAVYSTLQDHTVGNGRSMRFGYNVGSAAALGYAYAGWSLTTGNLVNWSPYQTLSFWIKGNAGGEALLLEVRDGNGVTRRLPLNNFVGVTTQWQQVSVPLSQFPAGLNFANIAQIHLVDTTPNTSGAVFVDDFTLQSSLPITNTPTLTPIPLPLLRNLRVEPGFFCPGQQVTVFFEARRENGETLHLIGALSADAAFDNADAYFLHDAGTQAYPVATWNNPLASPATDWNHVVFNAPNQSNTNYLPYSARFTMPATYAVGSSVRVLLKAASGAAPAGPLAPGTAQLSALVELSCCKFVLKNDAACQCAISNQDEIVVDACSSPSPSFSPTPSFTPTFTATPSRSPSPSPSATFSSTATPSSTPSFTPSPSPSPSSSPTLSFTATPSRTPSPSPTPPSSATSTPTATPTATASATLTASASPSPTSSETPSFSATPTRTATPSATGSPSPSPIYTPTATPTATLSFSSTSSRTPTSSATASPTETLSRTATVTHSATPSATASPTATPPVSATFSLTASPSFSASATRTASPSATLTRTPSPTATLSFSFTPSPTRAPTPPPLPIHYELSVYNAAGERVKVIGSGSLLVPPESLLLSSQAIVAGSGQVELTLGSAAGGATPFSWDGTNSNGQPVSGGHYYLKAEIVDAFGKTTTLGASLEVLGASPGAQVSIYNSAGELVYRESLAPPLSDASSLELQGSQNSGGLKLWIRQADGSLKAWQWNGRNLRGLAVDSGTYTVKLEQQREGQPLVRSEHSFALLRTPQAKGAPPILAGNRLILGERPGSSASLKLFALSGELVRSWQLGQPSAQTALDFSRLAPGIYFLEVDLIHEGVRERRLLKIALGDHV
jgi:hypothetical protein